jgi:acyl carrier protein
MKSSDEIVRKIFCDELGMDASQLDDELSYGDVAEWDSNTHMVIIAALEDQLETTIDEDDIVELTSIGKIKSYIESHR